jgi:4-hydroxybenzoate polyprenyltransferase
VPSIWKPFISVGSTSKIFNVGLLILSLNYLKNQKVAIGVLFIATLVLMSVIPVPYRLVVGYSLTLIAFAVILLKNGNPIMVSRD